MLMITTLVAWCIWTARERCHFWWFQPDPNQVEHKEDDETDDEAPASLLDVLRKLKTSLNQRWRMRSLPWESHPMQARNDSASQA